ncbi:MAG: MarR family transcriptional regulator [Lachnospiraceae bacterium]|nr:MarR family transcriptional regulator [Lachnospiraceae bacterium]
MKGKMEKCFCEEARRDCYADADRNHKLIINFRDINHTMRSQYEGRGSQKRILIVLLETGTITQRRLTERLSIQPGSVSEVLAKLEKGGLIVRTESPDDRRTTDIALTEQGKLQAEEALMQRRIRHEEMFSCLTEEEKSTLLALLEKVNGDWKKRYESGRR